MHHHKLSLPLATSLLLLSTACGEPADDNSRTSSPRDSATISLRNHSFEDDDMGDAERLNLHNGWDLIRHIGTGLAYVVKILPEHFDTSPAPLTHGEEAISFPLKPVDYVLLLSNTETTISAGEVYELSVTTMVRNTDLPPTAIGLTLQTDYTTPLAIDFFDVPAPGKIIRHTLRFTVPEGMNDTSLRPGFFAFNGNDQDADILFDHVELKRLSPTSAPTGLLNPDFESPTIPDGLFIVGAPGWQPSQLNFFGISHHSDDILPGGALSGDNVLEIGVRSDNVYDILTYPFAHTDGGESFQIDFSLSSRTDVDTPEFVKALLLLDDERILEQELPDLPLLDTWQPYSLCIDLPDDPGHLRFGFEVFRTGDNDIIQRLLLDDLQITPRSSPCDA